jgi:uncharacterized membrane protein YccC
LNDYRSRFELVPRTSQHSQSAIAFLSTHDSCRHLAFALAQVWNLPLHGLWAVLTAVVVTQISVGGSLHATTEYVMGTIVGAVYAAGVGILVPHTTTISLAGVLALTIGPLAYAAAVYPSFRVAPFTGAIVLLISTQFGEGLIESAFYRLAEVALGGAVALMVSLLVMPQRAHELALDAAARILDLLARLLPKLLAGFTRETRCQRDHGPSARGRARSHSIPNDYGRGSARAADESFSSTGSGSPRADLAPIAA